MLNMTVAQLLAVTGGQWIASEKQAADVFDQIAITSASIDSRAVENNGLFIAFKGEQVDGHAYIDNAAEKGAVIALVEDDQAQSAIGQIKVDSCQKAMADIAKACRQSYNGKVFGITGSCGKTTTKEMLACILQVAGKVSVTAGNQNNELGVPLTLYKVQQDSDYAVIEMGAAELGDIAYLMAMVVPDVSVVTNVRPAHIGRFGSEDKIAIAKGEIYTALPESSVGIVNIDEKYAPQWMDSLSDKQVMRYSTLDNSADVFADDIQLHLVDSDFTLCNNGEKQAVSIKAAGIHSVYNALAAASMALAAGVSLSCIAKGLQNYAGVKSRMQSMSGIWGGTLIDDCYNANPGSVKAAIDVLKQYPQKTILVLGDMGELGSDSLAIHEQVGLYAKNAGISALYSCGKDSQSATTAFGDSARHFNDKNELTRYLQTQLGKDDVVLVKGSRSAAMEDIIKPLTQEVET